MKDVIGPKLLHLLVCLSPHYQERVIQVALSIGAVRVPYLAARGNVLVCESGFQTQHNHDQRPSCTCKRKQEGKSCTGLTSASQEDRRGESQCSLCCGISLQDSIGLFRYRKRKRSGPS